MAQVDSMRCGNCNKYRSAHISNSENCPEIVPELSIAAFIQKHALDITGARDKINHPSHYNQGKYEVIDVIEDWKLNFTLGCVIKYLARASYKEEEVQDLQKARWYLNYEIDQAILRQEKKDDFTKTS